MKSHIAFYYISYIIRVHVRATIFLLISSFFRGRTQTVVYNGSISNAVDVISGVQHASDLYINDFPDCILILQFLLQMTSCLLYRKVIVKLTDKLSNNI